MFVIVLGSVPAQWEFRDAPETVFSLPHYLVREINMKLTSNSNYTNTYDLLLSPWFSCFPNQQDHYDLRIY